MKNETGDIRTLDGYFSFHANEEIFLNLVSKFIKNDRVIPQKLGNEKGFRYVLLREKTHLKI